jgi:hypothetical protein
MRFQVHPRPATANTKRRSRWERLFVLVPSEGIARASDPRRRSGALWPPAHEIFLLENFAPPFDSRFIGGNRPRVAPSPSLGCALATGSRNFPAGKFRSAVRFPLPKILMKKQDPWVLFLHECPRRESNHVLAKVPGVLCFQVFKAPRSGQNSKNPLFYWSKTADY